MSRWKLPVFILLFVQLLCARALAKDSRMNEKQPEAGDVILRNTCSGCGSLKVQYLCRMKPKVGYCVCNKGREEIL